MKLSQMFRKVLQKLSGPVFLAHPVFGIEFYSKKILWNKQKKSKKSWIHVSHEIKKSIRFIRYIEHTATYYLNVSHFVVKTDIHEVRTRPKNAEWFVSLLLTFQRPRRCSIFKVNHKEDSKIHFMKDLSLGTILLYQLVKSG